MTNITTFISIIIFVITTINANENIAKDAVLMCDFDDTRAICELLADSASEDAKIIAVYSKIVQSNLTTEAIDTNALQNRVKFLEISKTMMTPNLPQNIGRHFEILESFRVTKTNLKFVAKNSLENFDNLKHLSLDSNKIEIIYGDAFQNLGNLISLYISNNRIDFLHPQLFVNCPKLRYFWSDYNKLERIDEKIFENNHDIEWINLSHNRLKNVDVDLTHFKNLFYVNLERNFRNCNLIFDEFLSNNENKKIVEFQRKVNENCRN